MFFFFLRESICCDRYCHQHHNKEGRCYHFNHLRSSGCLESDARKRKSKFQFSSAAVLHHTTRLHGSSTAVKESKCIQKRGRPGWYDCILATPHMCFTIMTGKRHLLTEKHVRGNSWAVVTYVCVGPFIRPWAGERDKFMAPLVDHETANCRGRKETRGGCWERERDSERKKYTDRWRKTKGRERVRWLKYSVSLLIDM